MITKNLKKLVFIPICAMTLTSCFICVDNTSCDTSKGNNKVLMSPTLGGKLYSSVWIQRSSEYKALCLQAYNIAKLRLDESLAQQHSKPLAVITDIDETILDNTPNAVHQALKGEDYTDKSWNDWCDMAQADTLAGSLSFFKYAVSRGVEVFYVSNRNEVNRKGTLENLRKFGFPNVDNNHLLLRSKTSDKTIRRSAVEANYDVVLYIGDNLGDFSHKYDDINEGNRHINTISDANEFGKKFIILPNPNYGNWEKAMNGGYPSLDKRDKYLVEKLLKRY